MVSLVFGGFEREMMVACYTGDMQQFMNNRIVQICGLTLGLAILFYMALWLLFAALNLKDVPQFAYIVVSLGAAVWLVWKFYARRIG